MSHLDMLPSSVQCHVTCYQLLVKGVPQTLPTLQTITNATSQLPEHGDKTLLLKIQLMSLNMEANQQLHLYCHQCYILILNEHTSEEKSSHQSLPTLNPVTHNSNLHARYTVQCGWLAFCWFGLTLVSLAWFLMQGLTLQPTHSIAQVCH